MVKPRIQADMMEELEEMDGEFTIDESAFRKFHVKLARRWFMPRNVATHLHRISDHTIPIARRGEGFRR